MTLAAGDADGPRRSLILAGGGMRVAYQAGVLVALEEAGLRFHHADGTSGGTFNLAMLLSGVTPAQACERWRALKLRSFAAPNGIRHRVFPALGVDVAKLRAARGIAGTFNVCDFAAKTCVAIPHEEADLDVLTAGVSLPIVSPAVRRGGRTLLDAVWIKDANLTEALRRGSEELWLVWCIGNHGEYRNGPFQQYVHMIEIAANGALNEELALVRERGARLHVIRPRVPLPLDPDFFLGRIDASTLIAMGYRDAVAYLQDPSGVTPDERATRMLDPVPGVAVRERAGSLRLTWEVDDLAAFEREPRGTVVGDIDGRLLSGGRFAVERGVAEASFDGGVRVRRPLRGGSLELDDAELRTSLTWWDVHARGVAGPRARARVHARFARWLRSAR
jgi:hypothetical protein